MEKKPLRSDLPSRGRAAADHPTGLTRLGRATRQESSGIFPCGFRTHPSTPRCRARHLPHLPAKATVYGTRSPSTRGLTVIHRLARTLRFALVSGLVFILLGGPFPSRSAGAAPARKTVYLAGALSHQEALVFTSAVAGADPQAVILFDSPLTTPYLKSFLDAFHADTIIPVGPSATAWTTCATARAERPRTAGLGQRPPRAAKLVGPLPEGRPRRRLPRRAAAHSSRSACLAGPLRPLFITRDREDEADLRRSVAAWKANGGPRGRCRGLRACRKLDRRSASGNSRHRAQAVADACRHEPTRLGGPAATLVVANPEDL